MTAGPTTACIIQARRTSERLPDKVLLPLAGKPVVSHVISRCLEIPGVEHVVLATPDDPFEDPLASAAREAGALSHRGPLDDVLSRFWGAYQLCQTDYVMRVTADCPLIDPDLCQQLIDKTISKKAQYGALVNWPHGLDCEIFSATLLKKTHEFASEAVDREHVTLWMKKQPDLNRVFVTPDQPETMKGNRWVLDYPEDYDFLKQVFEKLPKGSGYPGWRDVIGVLEAFPELHEINDRCEQIWAEKNQQIYRQSGQTWRPPGT